MTPIREVLSFCESPTCPLREPNDPAAVRREAALIEQEIRAQQVAWARVLQNPVPAWPEDDEHAFV